MIKLWKHGIWEVWPIWKWKISMKQQMTWKWLLSLTHRTRNWDQSLKFLKLRRRNIHHLKLVLCRSFSLKVFTMKKIWPLLVKASTSYHNSNLKILKLSLISKSVQMTMKINKMAESFLNCSPSKFQRQLRTSDRYVLGIKVHSIITRRTFSIESSRDLWLKVEIPLIRMELEERVFTAINLLMSKSGTLILTKVSSRWRTQDLIQMVHNSSFVSVLLLIWIKNTQFSEELYQDTISSTKWKITQLVPKTSH